MKTSSIFKTALSSLSVLMFTNTVDAGVVNTKALGCHDVSKTTEGVDIQFYSYGYDSKLSHDKDFFPKLYASDKLHSISSYSEGLDFFQETELTEGPEMGDIYGYETTFTNFTLVTRGYFFPDETGYHTFEFFATTGAASLRVGSGKESCTGFVEKDLNDAFAINTLGTMEGVDTESFTTYLEKGTAYPVEMIVNNWKGYVFFAPSVIVPSGDNYMLDGYMFSMIKKAPRVRTPIAARK